MLRRKRILLVGLALMVTLPWLGTVEDAYAAPPVADGCDAGVRSDFNGDTRTEHGRRRSVGHRRWPERGRPGDRALRRCRRTGR